MIHVHVINVRVSLEKSLFGLVSVSVSDAQKIRGSSGSSGRVASSASRRAGRLTERPAGSTDLARSIIIIRRMRTIAIVGGKKIPVWWICGGRVIDNDWHARYTAVDIITIIIAVTTPAPTECTAELAVVVFEVPFLLVEGPVTTGCFPGLD